MPLDIDTNVKRYTATKRVCTYSDILEMAVKISETQFGQNQSY